MELAVRVLSRDEMRDIHGATIQVPSDVGVSITSEIASRLLDDAVVHVDYKSRTAKISEDLVERCVSSSIETPLDLLDRTPSSFIWLEGNRTYDLSSFDTAYNFDLETGKRRLATKHDAAQFTRLADALPTDRSSCWRKSQLPANLHTN